MSFNYILKLYFFYFIVSNKNPKSKLNNQIIKIFVFIEKR